MDKQSQEDQYKIDPGYYFKSLDPPQIQNMLTNFTTELDQGTKKFKDTLLVKYENILSCQNQFEQLNENMKSFQGNLSTLQTGSQSDSIGSVSQVLQKMMKNIDEIDEYMSHSDKMVKLDTVESQLYCLSS